MKTKAGKMSYYKPTGKELKIAKEIHKIMERFRKLSLDCGPVSAQIDIDHTLEGVRVNGWEKVVSLFDVKKHLREYKANTKREITELQKAVKITEKCLSKMKIFETCPSCKGQKGWWTDPNCRGQRGYWSECNKCIGRGILHV